ncbi:MAG TPA: NADH-quinone oxidoreductase subunit M, partial [Roseiflexaceae bacterium]|nr:NADH-quinone oxidoreductase subunit M [Roseiflexaceae bacterium]
MTYLQPSHFPVLTLLVLSPLVGMLLTFFAPNDRLVKRGAVAWSLAPLVLAVYLWAGFDSSLVRDGQGVVQFVERV